MEMEINTLCLIKKAANYLDIGIVTKIHMIPPFFELKTLLNNSLREYESNLIPIIDIEEIMYIEDAIVRLRILDPLILKKIKEKVKFTNEEIKEIEDIFICFQESSLNKSSI
jgi:hypothetical protein